MILLIILLFLHLLLFYNRSIRFYKPPYFKRNIEHYERWIYSPVEGEIVYITRTSQDSVLSKQGRDMPLPALPTRTDYYHIGIFMSPYNNHHLMSINNSIPMLKYELGDSLLSMTGLFENLFPFLRKTNWINNKLFLYKNKRSVFSFAQENIHMVMIYDKYVSKFTELKTTINNRPILGFVHRGSQADLFIPVDSYQLINNLKVGDKVNFNSVVAWER